MKKIPDLTFPWDDPNANVDLFQRFQDRSYEFIWDYRVVGLRVENGEWEDLNIFQSELKKTGEKQCKFLWWKWKSDIFTAVTKKKEAVEYAQGRLEDPKYQEIVVKR